jgi:hypothetical protein
MPQYAETFTTIGLLAIVEIVLPLWLFVKGVKNQPHGVPAT